MKNSYDHIYAFLSLILSFILFLTFFTTTWMAVGSYDDCSLLKAQRRHSVRSKAARLDYISQNFLWFNRLTSDIRVSSLRPRSAGS